MFEYLGTLATYGTIVGVPITCIVFFVGLVYSIYGHKRGCHNYDRYPDICNDSAYIIFCLVIPLLVLGYFAFWFVTIPLSLVVGVAYLIASKLAKYDFKFEISSKNEKITK